MTSHFSGSEQKLRETTPEEMRLQTASENTQRWCGRDVARQLIPGADSGDRKSSVVDSRVRQTGSDVVNSDRIGEFWSRGLKQKWNAESRPKFQDIMYRS